MKLRKIAMLILAMFVICGILMSTVLANTYPNLPPTVTDTSPSATVMVAANTYPLLIQLSNVPSGYDVTDGTYNGFCVDLITLIYSHTVYNGVTLVSSLTLGEEWNEINWILNNAGTATAQEVQGAIWLAQDIYTTQQMADNAGFTIDSVSQQLAADSENHETFVPSPGQILAVKVDVVGAQDLMIELIVPQYQSTIVTTLSKTSISLHDSVTDTATVTTIGGLTPTGSVTFQVSTDNGVTWTSYGAAKTLLAGSATSDTYTPAATGTYYFKAIYSGDSNYLGSQSGAKDEPLTVTTQKKPSCITTQLQTTCYKDSKSGCGDGYSCWSNYGCDSNWQSYGCYGDKSYSDCQNSYSNCYSYGSNYGCNFNWQSYYGCDNDRSCQTTIGTSVKDTAYVTRGATGQVRFEVSTNGITFTQYGALKTLPGGYNNAVTSDTYTPSSAGTYYFRAVYLGDNTYQSSQSGNKDEPLTVCKKQSSTDTCLSACSINLGKSVTDTATVTSGATGQVRFEVSKDGVTFTQFGAVKTLTSGSRTVRSDAYTPTSTGTLYFRAVYSGDSTYQSSQSGNREEPLCVRRGR
jgi:hypothetical protein